jgi:SAM-dependent methyltransferase
MGPDVNSFAAFYGSPKGMVAAHVIAARLRLLWPNLAGRRVLGWGHAAPYLADFTEADRVIVAEPGDPSPFALEGGNLAVVSEEACLPFPDAMFDAVVMVHGLENCESQRRFMREIWRVMAPDARLIVVAANRASLWAQVENSPFGHGRPYSRSQLDLLLQDALFGAERWDGALFMPPFGKRANVRWGLRWDRIGRRCWPGFAGVHIVEATKALYAAVPPVRGKGILARAKPSAVQARFSEKP